MKKTGIITFQFCLNFGAVLQNYALISYLRELGVEAYTLNAISEKQKNNNSLYHSKSGALRVIRNLILFPLHTARSKKYVKFQKFCGEELYLTEVVRNNNELSRLIIDKGFEILIVGSDQVWNPNNIDFEDMFMLPFESKAKKFGYAVSLGNATSADLNPHKDSIGDFKKVGVRERNSISTIKKYNSSVVHNVDPVLLLTADSWKKIGRRSNIKVPGPFLLCYFINKKNSGYYYKLACGLAKERKLRIYIVNTNYSLLSFRRNALIDLGPEDFISLIYQSEFVCTDSYHGTLFSTVLNKQFISFVNSPTGTDSRVKDYLEMVGLDDRMVFRDGVIQDKNIASIASNNIDYSNVNSIISTIPAESKSYLNSITL